MDRRAVTSHLDRMLRPLGFVRRGLTWNRRVGAIVDVVGLQVSKAGDAFTLNLGVLEPQVYETFWGEPAGGQVDETKCTVRTRLGYLAAARDVWWRAEDPGALGEVEAALVRYGLPFLEAHRSDAAMEGFLGASHEARWAYPPPVAYRALLMARAGDPAGGCALLRELCGCTSGAWRQKIEKLLARLNCADTAPVTRTAPTVARSPAT
jgi:hypothetical protein